MGHYTGGEIPLFRVLANNIAPMTNHWRMLTKHWRMLTNHWTNHLTLFWLNISLFVVSTLWYRFFHCLKRLRKIRHFERRRFARKLLPQITKLTEGPVSPPERCDFVSVKLEKVHELFPVCRICGKGVVFYHMAQYGLLYHKSLCN